MYSWKYLLKGVAMMILFGVFAIQIAIVLFQGNVPVRKIETTEINKKTTEYKVPVNKTSNQPIQSVPPNLIPLKSSTESLDNSWINNSPNIAQDNPALIEVVRRDFLQPPISRSIPYDFKNYSKASVCNHNYSLSELNRVDFNPSCGQIQALESILRDMTPGFYLDCGANDGVFISNTLWLERKLGWSGLLVEADPKAYAKIVEVKRKAWMSQTCLSVTKTPKRVQFYINPKYSEASGLIKSRYYGAIIPVNAQCIPVYTMLLALNRTVVDFFTLDVEGNEMEILETIPFDKVIFKVLAIEHLFIKGGKQALRAFMERKGYRFYGTVVKESSGDSIFLHPSVVLTEEQRKQTGHEDNEKFTGKRL